jgi:DNA-binding XRE family transcriptional regulator
MKQEIDKERSARVAAAVKASREVAMMTQDELAVACDLSERTIRRIESKGEASFETLRAIAAVLPINIAQIHRDVAHEYISTWKALLRVTRRTIVAIVLWWCAVSGVGIGILACMSDTTVLGPANVETDDSAENQAAWDAFYGWGHSKHDFDTNPAQFHDPGPMPSMPAHETSEMVHGSFAGALHGLRVFWWFTGTLTIAGLGLALALGFGANSKEARILDQRFSDACDRMAYRLLLRPLEPHYNRLAKRLGWPVTSLDQTEKAP